MCGLPLAIALNRSGIDVQVFESANEAAELGASVTCGWNALRALQLMGLYDPLLKQSGQVPQVSAMKFTVDQPGGPEVHAWTQSTDDLPPDLSFHRAALLHALAPLFPSNRIHFNKKCKDIALDSSSKSGLYRLYFQDGTSHQAHLVIGADGVRSTVRKVVFQGPASYSDGKRNSQGNGHAFTHGDRLKEDDKLMFTGIKMYRSLVPYDRLRQAGLEEGMDKIKICVGPDSGKIFTVPIKNGAMINVGAFAVVSPDPAGTYHPPLPAPWTAKNVPNAEVIEAFSNWSDLGVKKILREMGDPSCWSLHSVGPVLDTFVNGRIALIGDAAHASTPFLGAGVGQGIEDVFLLWKLLTEPRTSLKNLEGILQAYDTTRRPRANWVVKASGQVPRMWPILADQNLEESIREEAIREWDENWRKTRGHDVQVDVATAVRWLEAQGHFASQAST